MVCLVVIYDVHDGTEEEGAGYLIELAAATRHEPGCISYTVHRAMGDPRRFVIYECYKDEAALEAHKRSPHFERYGLKGLRTIARAREAVQCIPLGE